MSHQQFQVTSVNPNDVTGGGGCVCDPERQTDCKPPFAVFYGNEMDSLASPHVVVCRSCVDAVVRAFEGEVLDAGERMSGDRIVSGSIVVLEHDEPLTWDKPDTWGREVPDDDVPEV